MNLLITGSAGFIGYHLAQRLTADGHSVIGIDNINNYYDVSLKIARLEDAGIERNQIAYRELLPSTEQPNYRFMQLRLEDRASLENLFREHQFDTVIHLAAQAGVRYSIKNPSAYIQSNVVGFANMLECCRNYEVKHLVYASSSSVYGLNEKVPFSTADNVDHPVSLYAATKKSNELLAHSYSHLYGIPTTGLRFFTVYGPWGRPDMAYFLFTKAILKNKPIKVFNEGRMQRDFTYIDDIVEGIVRVADQPPSTNTDWQGEHPDPASSPAPYRIYNIGAGKPVGLLDFITTIEEELGQTAEKQFLPMQPGDVTTTFADTTALERDFGYAPQTDLREGIRNFVTWYKAYYAPPHPSSQGGLISPS